MNYDLWIGNFGVVPWFSFLFFLCLPSFLSLSCLLRRVCIVLEAIIISFKKALFLALLVISVNLSFASGPNSEDYFLAKGEQLELKIKDLSHFSVGNSEVIRVKYLKSKKKLLIKVKSVGFSDLVIWKKSGKVVVNIYGHTKRAKLGHVELQKEFQKLGLKTVTSSHYLYVSGEIDELWKLNIAKVLLKKNPLVIPEIRLNNDLKAKIVGEVYQELSQKRDALKCKVYGPVITCQIAPYQKKDRDLIRLEKKLSVTFVPYNSLYQIENYEVEFRLIKVETLNQKTNQIGLSQIDTDLNTIFSSQAFDTLSTNRFKLSEFNAEVEVMAREKVLMILDGPTQIQLGGEIPFESSSQNQGTTIRLKFAGLKVDMVLKRSQGKYQFELKHELTHPAASGIQGNKGKNIFHVKLDRHMKAFELDLKTKGVELSHLPSVQGLSFLQRLFGGSDKSRSHQKLIGVVHVTKKHL